MKLCPPAKRSEGSRRLLGTGKSQEEIATRIRVNQSTVARWCAGDKKPGPDARARMKKAFGIPEDAWEKPARRAPPAVPAAAATKAAVPEPEIDLSVRARAFELARDIDRLRKEAWTDDSNTTLERAKILNSATVTMKLLGTMTGETLEINESRILKLPAWRRLEEALLRALTPWPEALKAAGELLAQLGGESGSTS
jgi:transcriptional regulator with XRE-family HTH domain